MKKRKLERVVFTSFVVFISLVSLVFFVSCSKEDNNKIKPINEDVPEEGFPILKEVPYVSMPVPDELQKLVYNKDNSDVSLSKIKDTVVVYVGGGPIHIVDHEDYDLLGKVEDGLKAEGFLNHSVLGMRQAHDINSTVFASGMLFTEANAQEVNDKTVNIIEKVITWLKSNHKIVYLHGHSYGGFVSQHYMSANKIHPDGYVFSGTRMKSVQVFFDNLPKNNHVAFKDGIVPIIEKLKSYEIPYFNVVSKLKLNEMKNYTVLLDGNPMLAKTLYSLGGKDEAVGKIEKDEKDFLVKNKVALLYLMKEIMEM
ncbi:alpha/beta fold hydrolase [Flavobacterium poyangense]|uniref:hypothetical protein n=1 Tax=Flavobacterium poyangense TaxID=2204302 RepID=UPI0014207EE5|nr:hypothetical protein [Flavobacterium sp. JXAS1]